MIRREYGDRDGRCCSRLISGCAILLAYDEDSCGSYLCPFYKPEQCRDWIRKDTRQAVWLYAPEEVKHVHL